MTHTWASFPTFCIQIEVVCELESTSFLLAYLILWSHEYLEQGNIRVTLSYVGCVNSPNDTFTYVYVIHFDSDILTPFFGVTPRIFSSLPQGNSREVTWDASRHVSSVRALGEVWINVWHIFNPKTQSSVFCIVLKCIRVFALLLWFNWFHVPRLEGMNNDNFHRQEPDTVIDFSIMYVSWIHLLYYNISLNTTPNGNYFRTTVLFYAHICCLYPILNFPFYFTALYIHYLIAVVLGCS